ncbi:hypothetical protein PV326_007202, partial [Microctonus aethiopoides]
MGMEKFFRATPIHGSDSLFIQLQFPFLKTTARPFVPDIPGFDCKRILFHSITDIEATTGRTANPRAVPKSGGNFLRGAVMFFQFKENFTAQCIPNDPVNSQIEQLDDFSGPIDQNLEKIKGT